VRALTDLRPKIGICVQIYRRVDPSGRGGFRARTGAILLSNSCPAGESVTAGCDSRAGGSVAARLIPVEGLTDDGGLLGGRLAVEVDMQVSVPERLDALSP
jgi:hypothetical protein